MFLPVPHVLPTIRVSAEPLKGIGVAQKLDSTIRMSFGMFNMKEEVDYTIDVLK